MRQVTDFGQPKPSGLIGQPKPKPLGLIWIYSPYPVMISGLTEILRTEARIYNGQEPPANGTPTVALLCPGGTEDAASKVEELQALVPGVPIVVLSSSCDLRFARSVLRAGARGLIHFGMEPSQIVRALSVVLEGELALPRALLNELVMEEDAPPTDLGNLTHRQQEILGLIAQGLTNAQIAQRLFLSESTVKQHLRASYKVLGVSNRTEAAKLISAGG